MCIRDRLADVLNVLQDAEIGGRGFIITGDDSFLQPYQNAETKIGAAVNDLRILIADNPAQLKRLAQADPIIVAKLSLTKRYIEMRKARQRQRRHEHLVLEQARSKLTKSQGLR